MNNILIILAISIFIFFVVIFSIIYIAINHSNTINHSDTINHSNTINHSDKALEEAVKESTSIYDDYSLSPDYNLINIEYQIIGTLSSEKAEPETIILPLYGKRVKSYRWKYFTMVNNLKIDIIKERNNQSESCMKECDILENNEIITIPTYTNTKFIVQLYDYKPPF